MLSKTTYPLKANVINPNFNIIPVIGSFRITAAITAPNIISDATNNAIPNILVFSP